MKNYAAAIVTFLNREDQKETTGFMYPITKIILKTVSGSTQKVFIVNEKGEWEVEYDSDRNKG